MPWRDEGSSRPAPAWLRVSAFSEDAAPGHDPDHPRVLFVCSGNLCRSAFAARYLRTRPGLGHLEVSSAGTRARQGVPVDPVMVQCARRHDIDLDGHQARQLTTAMVLGADLIVVFGPEHREWIFASVPEAIERVVPVGMLGYVLPTLGRHRLVTWRALPEILRDRPAELWVDTWIADPYRRGWGAYCTAVSQIVSNLDLLATRVEWHPSGAPHGDG